jgi:hypothetical protein
MKGRPSRLPPLLRTPWIPLSLRHLSRNAMQFTVVCNAPLLRSDHPNDQGITSQIVVPELI